MVREQLGTTATEVEALLGDLAANQVSDAVESASLATLRDSLRAIASEPVARAADLLRAQVGAKTRDPQPAIAAVNEAARKLAGLVLQRGIDASREVFARETHMLSRELAVLRLRLINATPDQAEALAKGQEEVAAWTDALLDQLTQGMRYDQRPLAVLGLSRRIHDLRTRKITDAIRKAAALAREGNTAGAAAARIASNSFRTLILGALLLGIVAPPIGIAASAMLNLPTGPCIVLVHVAALAICQIFHFIRALRITA